MATDDRLRAVGPTVAGALKIGTWNLDGRCTDLHSEFLTAVACDVWLLTEVNPSIELTRHERQLTSGVMARGQHWAGIYSRRPLERLPEPHQTSAAAVIDDVTFCSSVLPYEGMGEDAGWPKRSHAEETKHVIDELLGRVLTKSGVWGGDWNHGVFGPESSGSKGGRRHLLDAISRLELNVPTAHLPHRIPELTSIDHIGVPPHWSVLAAARIPTPGLSDHDCYVIDVRVGAPDTSTEPL